MTLRQTLAATAALSIVLHLSGCDRLDPKAAPPTDLAQLANAAPPLQPAVIPSDHAIAAPAVPAPDNPDESPASPASFAAQPAPDLVLRDWGAAIERRDWAAVRALWGQHGADSGLSARAFAVRWDSLRRPHVTIGTGDQEGAAGSLYYSAPVTITDGPRKFGGELTLRRVNDVDGATAEQLRWHFDPGTRVSWTTP